MNISHITEISDDISYLAGVARTEGHGNIETLIYEFQSGANRFDQIGEALFGVYENSKLKAIGGVNIDPYEPEIHVARVRRLYVHPTFRRRGVASILNVGDRIARRRPLSKDPIVYQLKQR